MSCGFIIFLNAKWYDEKVIAVIVFFFFFPHPAQLFSTLRHWFNTLWPLMFSSRQISKAPTSEFVANSWLILAYFVEISHKACLHIKMCFIFQVRLIDHTIFILRKSMRDTVLD